MTLQPPRASERQAVLQQWFREATQLHTQGKIAEAETYYQAILKAQPNHLDAIHLLGVLRLQQERFAESAKLVRQVLRSQPNLPQAHVNLANALTKLGRFEEALASYDRAIVLKPDYVEAVNNRGVVLLQAFGRCEDALACWDRVLALKPDHAEALFNRGLALTKLDRFEEAIASYDKALAVQPIYPEARNNRGLTLVRLKRLDEALADYDQAIAEKPDYAEAYNNRGILLADFKRYAEALECYDKAISITPDFANAWNNRGVVLRSLKRHIDAIASCDRALSLQPTYPEALNNRGLALQDLGRVEDALSSYDRAIKQKPDYVAPYYNRGLALNELGRYAEAFASFDKSLEIEPGNVEGIFSRSYVSLLTGDFPSGWPGYALRFEHAKQEGTPATRLAARYPRWRGEDLAGKRIVVAEEQGMGDILQFARYLTLLAARGADVTFFVRRNLHRLLSNVCPSARLVEALPDQTFDFQSALLDLPAGFGTTLATIPGAPSTLLVEPALVEKWRARIGEVGQKIGIVWQGNPDGSIDIGRSIPLKCFAPLAHIPGVRLISLQKNHGLDQLNNLPAGMTVETLGDDFDAGPDAFLDTAAVMASLDLVVTSDTSIAHLAGSLGRPTWLALKSTPEWRWLLDRTDSPWYPSMRLYRQQSRGDWSNVFERIAADLKR